MRLIFTCSLFILLFSCKKSVEDISSLPRTDSVINVASADSFYLKAKFNGVAINWVVPSHKMEDSFTYHGSAATGYSDLSNQCIEGYCYYVYALTQFHRNVPDIKPLVSVGFNMASPGRSNDVILPWFAPGTKDYQYPIRVSANSDLLNPAKNGIVVYYRDQNGKQWCTNLGSQQNSFFESVSINDEKRTDVSTIKVWKARFTCKLYDSTGNFITVEDGEIYGPVLLRF
jgi:hypothetical protein